jgi:hypothetical protein
MVTEQITLHGYGTRLPLNIREGNGLVIYLNYFCKKALQCEQVCG